MFVKLQYPSAITKDQVISAIKSCVTDTLDPSTVVEEVSESDIGWTIVGDYLTSLTLRSNLSDRDGYKFVRIYSESNYLYMAYGDSFDAETNRVSFLGSVESNTTRLQCYTQSNMPAKLVISITPKRLLVHSPTVTTPNVRTLFGVMECEYNSETYAPDALLPILLFGYSEDRVVQHPTGYSYSLFQQVQKALSVQYGFNSYVNRMKTYDGRYQIFETGFSVSNSCIALKSELLLMKYEALADFEDVVVFGGTYAAIQTRNETNNTYLLRKE